MRIAVLDDYAGVALELANWSPLQKLASVEVFTTPLGVPDEAATALADFDVVCCMRERMALPATLIQKLPRLKFIVMTGATNRSLDMEAATAAGIPVACAAQVGDGHNSTVELAWGLIIAAARQLPNQVQGMREGRWQTRIGVPLFGRTLGILGLGRLGQKMVPVAKAFGMNVIAWSSNLDPAKAKAIGVQPVEKEELFRRSDILSIHLVLSERSRGIVGMPEFSMMKPSAWIVNTSRGAIVDRHALVTALAEKRIAGAALDVFDEEPLPARDPLRDIDNLILTPHLGYSVSDTLSGFYQGAIEIILAYLCGTPINVVNAEGLARP
ncbi:D-2-hydroxyacid dehydrogenase family protein [Aminobacter sp. AP02]|uniref:D-2-hydroxyacid dehydrogenase family protein n=1 Tax=Aminobacter sp. AP02 TaxID=2135737 RepID=UPI000D6CCD23|nr:D-2-hydroxyacid dehydrogenase family protein [Aminobacter sp. AP02]PWK60336.1 lactate dehydrogenase-like 2-hydroxyacid dehydrogenase [Aminobacter sp. AP02]